MELIIYFINFVNMKWTRREIHTQHLLLHCFEPEAPRLQSECSITPRLFFKSCPGWATSPFNDHNV